jgi:hypothetical protein
MRGGDGRLMVVDLAGRVIRIIAAVAQSIPRSIRGARKLSQLQDNLASFNVALSAEQVKALDEASQIDPGFSYHLYAKESVRAIAFGGMREQIMA